MRAAIAGAIAVGARAGSTGVTRRSARGKVENRRTALDAADALGIDPIAAALHAGATGLLQPEHLAHRELPAVDENTRIATRCIRLERPAQAQPGHHLTGDGAALGTPGAGEGVIPVATRSD